MTSLQFRLALEVPLGTQRLLPGRNGVGMFVIRFGQDRSGELYVMGKQGFTPTGTMGQVFKVYRVND